MAERIDANINKETVSFICTQIGVTSSFLVKKTGFAEDKIGAWLDVSNDAYPTLNQAKTLAKALKVPFAGLYMHKDNIPIKKLPSLLNLRRVPDALSDGSALNLAVVELIRYHDFLSSAESDLDIVAPQLTLPSVSDTETSTTFAAHIRTFFGLELSNQFKLQSARQFYLYVRQQVESKGIFVHCFTGVDVEIARGISIFNETAPIIGINNNDRYPAKTFSIIHELVHILKKQSTLCNEMFTSFSSQDEEVFCNAVAGEVLVPAASLNVVLTAQNITSYSLDTIETIAKKYSVSKEVIARRLYDTSRISKYEYDTYANEIRQNFENEKQAQKLARQESRGHKIVKVPSREAVDKTSPAICKVLLIGYSDGYFSKQEVSGLLGIKEKHIPKFLTEVAKW
ncbi:MAG: ImmA/IrrE family metallo-endopeptidase [Oscillospiraceae bacterium]|jgi:Zn-dependent peptidase ImmA (M78 family)|nr:ImmA/IrrE family metallo-endopeptidase [Oscillospiraceae bacterium]